MLSFIQRVQTPAWLDLSKQSRTPQVTTVEVTENSHTEHGLLETLQSIPRSTPKLESLHQDDAAFARILDLYLPLEIKERAEGELSVFADAAVSKQVMDWVAEAERHPPHIQHWDSWGEKKDDLVTSQGWKYLWRFGISERLAALPSLTEEYEGNARMIQMLKGHLFAPSSATSIFHLILSDGVAALLSTHLRGSKIDKPTRQLFQHAHDRLTSTDDKKGWTSGLWMTERGGGSDLTPTETTATYSPLSKDDDSRDADGFPLGPWVLNGLKWFSTGTEASMAIAVARTPNGLSTFYVPMRRTVTVNGVNGTELNGVRIRRIKKKVGTHPLPTSELELKGMRGWLVGTEGKGITEIGVVLNITRIYLAVSALGYAGRSLSAARAFSRVRKVARGTQLSSVPLHMRSLAKAHVTYRAQMALSFFVVALLAKHEQQQASSPVDLVPKSSQDASCLLRLLGSVAKASAAMDSCGMAQVGMESLGGVGYLENDEMEFNVARLWRDTASTLIGEGTTDVLATDVVKVLKGKIGSYVMAAFGRWVKSSLPKKEFMAPETAILSEQWSELQKAISSNTLEYLTMNGREIMDRICKLTCGILLLADAARDGNSIAMEVARRWIRPTLLVSGLSVEQELKLCQQIVFGDQPIWMGLP
ncbi:hypothetical protein N7520_006399 [Penicillium odoratum]|uniref:uncharacterized protein n=1 Tax=Penicillium odoratum TaxID=1167516 RepID=UPI002546985E|nr:uncharacterized protein N7520_006399 [Penicillium odoratum]KAJ5759243.1 hypothetical protein N7520_006399 [Penicillium odoratum]